MQKKKPKTIHKNYIIFFDCGTHRTHYLIKQSATSSQRYLTVRSSMP